MERGILEAREYWKGRKIYILVTTNEKDFDNSAPFYLSF